MKTKSYTISLFLVALLSFGQLAAQTTPARPGKWATKVETCKLSNLYKLNDSVYRCEQPDEAVFSCLGILGIRSVLNLRSYHVDSNLVKGTPIKPYTVEMVANKFTDKEIIAALRILVNSPKPVVVHCLHGSDRTGVVIAMYRIIFENWTREQALDELQNGGFGFHTQYKNIISYVKNVDIDLVKKQVFNR